MTGNLTLTGPRYGQLPRDVPGFYEVLLRVEVTRDREALSALGNTGGSDALFSGAAAGFPLETLEYRVAKETSASVALPSAATTPYVVVDDGATPDEKAVSVRWDGFAGSAAFVQIEIVDPETGKVRKLLSPADKGYAVVPTRWIRDRAPTKYRYEVTLLDPERNVIGEPVAARLPEN